ncbi:DUF418 domain-containing protein [Sphingomicrobium nitratireducens]|uniref:DUF418 domain-containing protein n=1 Tax=Sphingomicrobium nitratireducens TaxID=2964666 RepID=UPI00223FC32A|nr:DUF418 domain-containing protein [Sphingomicrobium nitratireducens]
MNDTVHRPAGPIDAAKRILFLDGLRGLALCGILIANMAVFSGWFFMDEAQRAALPMGGANRVFDFLLDWLVVGKFYGLFSLLFGIGFALQIKRLGERGEGVARYMRRLFILLLIGLAHLLLLWMGDIVALYALLGFPLLLFRNASDRTLLVWAAGLWLFTIAWSAFMILTEWFPWTAFMPTIREVGAAVGAPMNGGGPYQFYTTATFGEGLRAHIPELLLRYTDLLYQMRYTKVLGLFLVGLWIGRHAIPSNLEAFRPLMKKVARWGLVVGLPMAALSSAITLGWIFDRTATGEFLGAVGYGFGTPALTLAYASLAGLAWSAGKNGLLTLFAPAGRMALTNYITQSVLNSVLFLGWGAGLMGKVPFVAVVPITLAIFFAQILFSRWWLARYRFGPLEWVWRSLTYGEAQPMRLAVSKAAND